MKMTYEAFIKRESKARKSDWMWERCHVGRYIVTHKPTLTDCDVYVDWQHKGRYMLDRINGNIIHGKSNLTKTEIQNEILAYLENS